MTPACASCGNSLAPGARFCRECGAPVAVGGVGGVGSTTVVESTASAGVVGRNCPYCHFPLKEGAPVTGCEFCHAVHHTDCWSDNGGCAVASCEGGPDGAAHPAMPTPVMPAAARPADKLQVDFGPAAPPTPQPASAGGVPERRGRGLWVALVVAVIVAILAGGATAAALIVSKKDDGDTSASAPATDPGGDGQSAPPSGGGQPRELADLTDRQIKSQIIDVVERNIKLVSDGNYREAWVGTLSAKYRAWKTSEKGYADWEDGQRKSDFYRNPPVRVTIGEKDPSTGEISAVIDRGISTRGGADNRALTCYCGQTWFRLEDGEMRWDIGFGSDPERADEWRDKCANIGQPETDSCTGKSFSY